MNLKIFLLTSFLLIVFTFSKSHAQLITNKELLKDIQTMLPIQKKIAGEKAKQLFSVFEKSLTADENQALEYLIAYMPLNDMGDFDGEYFYNNVKTTLLARKEMTWGKSIPEEIFLHYVLPIRTGNEDIDNFRPEIYEILKARVQGKSMYDAALEINHWCHEKANYRPTDGRTSSPLATIKTGFGRCGEESVFAVSALRAVGIPARQVYTPRWAHTDDNHAWVEVWADGKWYYLGACEPEPKLDMGWFTEPARRAMLVHTRAYGKYFGEEEVISNQKRFAELNVTSKYAQTANIVVKVLSENSTPAENTNVEFQLYNYGEFFPIALKKTDKNGLTEFSSGLGDLIVCASNEFGFSCKKISMGNIDTLTLVLSDEFPLPEMVFDVYPPIEKTPIDNQVSESKAKENSKRLQAEDVIRNNYMATFPDSAYVRDFSIKNNFDESEMQKIFKNSYGNWKEIENFLLKTPESKREWAVLLLQNVADKDLRDIPSEILFDHLNNAFKYNSPLMSKDKEMFAKYILSPRIERELISDWRRFLQSAFDYDFMMDYKTDENVLIDWIKNSLTIDNETNMHSRVPISPRSVFEMKRADERSRNIFYVAVARSFGHAARINPETWVPQYFDGQTWVNVEFYDEPKTHPERGFVSFVSENKNIDPKYAINFTISRLINNRFRTVDLEFEQPISKFPEKVEVEAGQYRLITGNRQTDGSVLSGISYFEVLPGQVNVLNVNVRESLEPLTSIGKISSNNAMFTNYINSKKENIGNILKDENTVLVWLDPTKEPSRHVLNDIPSLNTILEKEHANIVFFLSPDLPKKAFKISDYKNLPKNAKFLVDNNFALLSEVEKIQKRNLKSSMPIIVITDKDSNVYFYSEGYRIGVGDEIGKILMKMKW